MATGYTPIYRVFRNGADITSKFNDRTTTIKVECSGGSSMGGDTCEIELDDRDWAIAFPQVGDFIEIHLGYNEVGLAPMGQFEINGVYFLGPPRKIRLVGTSIGMSRILKAPTIEGFEEKSVSDIIKSLGERAGLSVTVHPSYSEVLLPFRNQVVSPMHMLRDFERAFNGIVKVNDGELTFTPRDAGETASGLVMPILRLGPSHFGTWEVYHSNRTYYSSTRAAYWDREENVRRWVDAPMPNAAAALQGYAEGYDLPFQIGRMFNSEQEAQEAANSQASGLLRAGQEINLTLAKGDPWIKDQQRIQVSGMRDGIDGSYTAETVAHTYVKNVGISTQIQGTINGDGSLYDAATDEFLIPQPGELMGEVITGVGGLIAGGV